MYGAATLPKICWGLDVGAGWVKLWFSIAITKIVFTAPESVWELSPPLVDTALRDVPSEGSASVPPPGLDPQATTHSENSGTKRRRDIVHCLLHSPTECRCCLQRNARIPGAKVANFL